MGMSPYPEKTQYLVVYGYLSDEAHLEHHFGGKYFCIAYTPIKIYGISINTMGLANPLIENLRTTWHRMRHLIKGIASHSRGPDLGVAKQLVSAMLHYRIRYGEPCFHLNRGTGSCWKRYTAKCRVITGLLKHTRAEKLYRYAAPSPIRAPVEHAAEGHFLRAQYARQGPPLWRYLGCGVTLPPLPEKVHPREDICITDARHLPRNMGPAHASRHNPHARAQEFPVVQERPDTVVYVYRDAP